MISQTLNRWLKVRPETWFKNGLLQLETLWANIMEEQELYCSELAIDIDYRGSTSFLNATFRLLIEHPIHTKRERNITKRIPRCIRFRSRVWITARTCRLQSKLRRPKSFEYDLESLGKTHKVFVRHESLRVRRRP